MKYRLQDHVSLTNVDDEAVLLDLDSGAYFGLNHVGAQFMQSLNDELSKNDAIAKLAEEYQQSKEQVKQDIDALLEQLLAHNLIVEISSTT